MSHTHIGYKCDVCIVTYSPTKLHFFSVRVIHPYDHNPSIQFSAGTTDILFHIHDLKICKYPSREIQPPPPLLSVLSLPLPTPPHPLSPLLSLQKQQRPPNLMQFFSPSQPRIPWSRQACEGQVAVSDWRPGLAWEGFRFPTLVGFDVTWEPPSPSPQREWGGLGAYPPHPPTGCLPDAKENDGDGGSEKDDGGRWDTLA